MLVGPIIGIVFGVVIVLILLFSAIKILQRICGTNEIEVCPDTGELYVTTPVID